MRYLVTMLVSLLLPYQIGIAQLVNHHPSRDSDLLRKTPATREEWRNYFDTAKNLWKAQLRTGSRWPSTVSWSNGGKSDGTIEEIGLEVVERYAKWKTGDKTRRLMAQVIKMKDSGERGVVVWISVGAREMPTSDNSEVRQLIDNGWTVLGVSQLSPEGKDSLDQQVQNVVAATRFAREIRQYGRPVVLVGPAGAGAWVVAALATDPALANGAVIDIANFEFPASLSEIRRYRGIIGMLAMLISSNHRMFVAGVEDETSKQFVQSAAKSAKKRGRIEWASRECVMPRCAHWINVTFPNKQ